MVSAANIVSRTLSAILLEIHRFFLLNSGIVTRFFGNFLFYESNPSGPLINRLKWLCLDICFRGDIQNLSLKNLTPRSVSQREVRLHAVLVTFGFLQI